MATQDLIEFSGDDAEDDDVQAILAALQTRKEKQQKLKKTIRDRAQRSQKQLKEDSDVQDPVVVSIQARLRGYEDEIASTLERISKLPPISDEDNKGEEEELLAAHQAVHDFSQLALKQAVEIESRFSRRLRSVKVLLISERDRSDSKDVVTALSALAHEVEQALQDVENMAEVMFH